MGGAVSIRLAAVARPGGWIGHDWRDSVPRYAAAEEPPGGRIVVVLGTRPDMAAEAAEAARRREAAGIRGGRPPVLLRGVVVSLSREAQRDLTEGRVALADADAAVAAALRAEWGEDVVYVIRHTDETAPHWHAVVRTVRPDGRARRYGPADCAALQDRVGAVIQQRVGWTRGVPRAVREARGEGPARTRHRSVRELHASMASDLAAAEAEVARLREKVSSLEARVERAVALGATFKARAERAEMRLVRAQRALAEALALSSALSPRG